MDPNVITIVSGLPRSGTSMMMKMLEAGGTPVLVDNIRQADEDNPNGYYEFELVKKVKDDTSWLDDAGGKVVKMVSMLLKDLPAGQTYKIVFMRRKMEEILASQKQMLVRNNKPTDTISDEKMAALFEKHLKEIFAWLEKQSHMHVLYVNYNDMVANPLPYIAQINDFLGKGLDTEKMAGVIDKKLYRQKK